MRVNFKAKESGQCYGLEEERIHVKLSEVEPENPLKRTRLSLQSLHFVL